MLQLQLIVLRLSRSALPRTISKRGIHCTAAVKQKSDNEESSVLDGLEANSRWRKGQLSKITDSFECAEMQPMKINCDEEVQPMWKDMESRVTRRKSITMDEAFAQGRQVGRRNVRKTDEEAWSAAGLYDEK